MRSLATVSLLLGLSAISAPIYAKESAASSIAGSVMLCDSIVSEAPKLISALQQFGWKDVTPSIGGRSMVEITGSYQLKNGRDIALVSGPKSMVGANCQFDIAKLSKTEKAELAETITQLTGSDASQTKNRSTWTATNGSISILSSSGSKVTILWLPKKADAE